MTTYQESAVDGLVVGLTDGIDPSLRSAVSDGLRRYNVERAGYADSRSLAVAISAANSGKALGGLRGRTSYGVFFIDLVWLQEKARGRGLGTRILAMAEGEARRRGCSIAVLYTTVSLDAAKFYERLGYEEFGRIEPKSPGLARVYLRKCLA